MHIGSEPDVLLGAADLQNPSHLTLSEDVGRHPDSLYEIELLQQIGERIVFAGMTQGRLSHEDACEIPSVILFEQMEVVFRDQLMCLGHGHLGLVPIRALRQGHELSDPPDRSVLRTLRSARHPVIQGHVPSGCLRVGPQQVAGPLEGRAVGGLLAGAQDLLCKLVGHLVQQHLQHRIPGMAEHEIPAQRYLTPFPGPRAPRPPVIPEAEERWAHSLPVRFVQDPQGCFPFTAKPMQDAVFERFLADGFLHVDP